MVLRCDHKQAKFLHRIQQTDWMIHRLSGWLADQYIKHVWEKGRRREGIGLYSQLCTFMAYLCVTEIHYKEFHRKQVATKAHTTCTDRRIAPQMKNTCECVWCVCMRANGNFIESKMHLIPNVLKVKVFLHIEREDGSVLHCVKYICVITAKKQAHDDDDE